MEPAPRPRNVTIAATIWIVFAVILALGGLSYALNPEATNLNAGPFAPVFLIGLGAAFVILAIRLRKGGNGARIALTVMGALLLVGVWTVLFVVPALVFQFLPDSNAWFKALTPPKE
ncbi:hypothetical protein [Actinomadura rugatobispora]|uniref:DUF4190 domain-containing protein n=1 Tax=Actinomadura rugatobispora TaxID=1994 RepID=A0ABW1A587_9ACTN|nr:hypothetical protein GCM10010200_049480 [Actinomadura rugatobispora]